MPEIRSGKIGPDHQLTFRKKSPLKLLIGIAAVVLIAMVLSAFGVPFEDAQRISREEAAAAS